MRADLQPATPDMAPAASVLIYLTVGTVADYLFGGGSSTKAQQVLERLFRRRHNYFSHEYAVVAAASGAVIGIVIGYSVRFSDSLNLPTAYHLLRVIGALDFGAFLVRARPLIGIKEAEADEYFIAHVAVLPDHQGQGLGTQLLLHAEQTARQQGFHKVALTVETENERAVALYLRTGFKVVETVRVPALEERIGYGGFHRMRKLLA